MILFGQNHFPIYTEEEVRISKDWLLSGEFPQTQLYESRDGHLVLSNGLVSRTFSTKPNGATIGLKHLQTGETFLRSVRPEAEVEIDGVRLPVGGLTGQPIHNYLLPGWLKGMKTNPLSFKLVDYRLEDAKQRFPWKKRKDWMPRDLPWPLPGKELIFTYRINDEALKALAARMISDDTREVLYEDKFEYLKQVNIVIHYELYDGIPAFSKWISVENHSDQEINLQSFKSEILAATEPESTVDNREHWKLPNITVETDYNFGGMSSENVLHSSVGWNPDPLYKTQVNYSRTMPVLLEVTPKYGPDQTISPDSYFNSYRVWELLHDSWDRERKGLEHRRLMRSIAPWVTENPILMHVRNADDKSVKKAIDQCAEVGFEMVIMTFGSGFNAEDVSEGNLFRMKALADYAHSRGIALGGYSLLASRSVGGGNDVVMPEGMTPRFGHSPCLESEWGEAYFDKLYKLYSSTGLDILEHDGSYPGDVCASTSHPGHNGLEDSQWNQYQRIKNFYEWCREKGIYLNVPDYYFLAGSNKTGMGYRETNWSLPRAQQEIIERQNIYDGTWNKTPSMGWMFVPLVEYHGGGEAATIEPLKDHLTHYGQRLANLFGAGVQACYRGPELYDSPGTRTLVKKWVDFYKLHRQVLDGDIIHLRRPDGLDWDGILHVNPDGNEKGLLMVYNPLEIPITRELSVPMYYTGLHEEAGLQSDDGKSQTVEVDRDYKIHLSVTIPARGYRYFVMK